MPKIDRQVQRFNKARRRLRAAERLGAAGITLDQARELQDARFQVALWIRFCLTPAQLQEALRC